MKTNKVVNKMDENSAAAVMTQLRQTAPGGPLGEVVRVRLDEALVAELDRIEAFARGRGLRHVTRSSLIRSAIESFVVGVRETVPELAGPHAASPGTKSR